MKISNYIYAPPKPLKAMYFLVLLLASSLVSAQELSNTKSNHTTTNTNSNHTPTTNHNATTANNNTSTTVTSAPTNVKEVDNTPPPIFAQVYLYFANTYFWRGLDFHADKFGHSNQDEKIYDTAWTIQPEVTFFVPKAPGLFFDIWATIPIQSRSPVNGKNGLKNQDQVDLTVGYSYSSKYGTPSVGAVLYVYPTAGLNYADAYIGYTAPSLLSPTIKTYFAPEDGRSYIYSTFDISHPFTIPFGKTSSSLTITPTFLAGYWFYPVLTYSVNSNLLHFDFKLPICINIIKTLNLVFIPSFTYRLFDGTGKFIASVEKNGAIIQRQPYVFFMTLGVNYSF